MSTDTRTLTTPLDADLYDEANSARVRRRWSWRQMIEAALAPVLSTVTAVATPESEAAQSPDTTQVGRATTNSAARDEE